MYSSNSVVKSSHIVSAMPSSVSPVRGEKKAEDKSNFFSFIKNIFSPSPASLSGNRVSRKIVRETSADNINALSQKTISPKTYFDTIKNTQFNWNDSDIHDISDRVLWSLDSESVKPLHEYQGLNDVKHGLQNDPKINEVLIRDGIRMPFKFEGGVEASGEDGVMLLHKYFGDDIANKVSNWTDQNVTKQQNHALRIELTNKIKAQYGDDCEVMLKDKSSNLTFKKDDQKAYCETSVTYEIQIMPPAGFGELPIIIPIGDVTVRGEISAELEELKNFKPNQKLPSLEVKVSHSEITEPAKVPFVGMIKV
jgi:hypothetical protein